MAPTHGQHQAFGMNKRMVCAAKQCTTFDGGQTEVVRAPIRQSELKIVVREIGFGDELLKLR